MMPLEESVKGKLFVKNIETGGYDELGEINAFENLNKATEETIKSIKNFKGTLSFEIEIKHITRKRLKKLLMSKRYQRNEAEQICNRIWFKQQCYKEIDLIKF